MGGRNLTFRLLYAFGLTPWDGHALARCLIELVDSGTLTPGSALDLGCGTGDNAIYLAEHGWRVTGVDYVEKPLAAARRKAAGRDVEFVKADVTRLGAAGIGSGFDLVIDSGCLHGMNPDDRDAYVREVTSMAAPHARLLIVAMPPGASRGVRGIGPDEIERRFAGGWTLSSSGDEPTADDGDRTPARYYLFVRTA